MIAWLSKILLNFITKIISNYSTEVTLSNGGLCVLTVVMLQIWVFFVRDTVTLGFLFPDILGEHSVFISRVKQPEKMSIIFQQDATRHILLYFCKLLYMFRVVTPPIISSTCNCNYSIWHWSNFGKWSVWIQLKMGGMNPSLLPSAIVVKLEIEVPTPLQSRKGADTGLYLSSLAEFTHCIFRRLTSARCCNYSYICS